jgi:hypothetical protein
MKGANPVSAAAASASPGPAWALALRRFNNWLSQDFLGGPRPWKFAWVINFQKGGTFFFLGFLIWWYGNTSTAAWIYLALHGTYGLVWLVKDLAFPDPNWQVKITIGGGINAFLGVLGWYWVFGWLLISGTVRPVYPLPDHAWFALCISLCMLGSVIMIAADAQKYYTLRVKRGLITDGMHRYHPPPQLPGRDDDLRQFRPDGLALAAGGGAGLGLAGGLFSVNMVLKEASMSRYPEWAAYKKRTWWLVPGLL